MTFFQELKRRNIFKVASVYLVMTWLVLQIVAVTFPLLNLPSVYGTIITVTLFIGFPFVCIFAWAFEITPEGLKFTKDVAHEDSIRHETGGKINRLLVGGLICAVVIIIYQQFFVFQPDEDKELTIAVLPFQDMSNDKSQEYFGDGIAEEILNSLARLDKMLVIARTSSFKFKNQNDDIREIGRLLNANYVLEGSVRKDKKTIRITAQLIETDSGIHIWSQTFDRELENIFALQDELTYAITQALKIKLLPEEMQQEPGMTSNQQAYDLFLQGRELGYQRNAKALNMAITLLQQAIVLDSEFHLAKAQLYIVYLLAIGHGGFNKEQSNKEQESLFSELIATNIDFPTKNLVKAMHLDDFLKRRDLALPLARLARQQAPSNSIVNNWSLLLEIGGSLTIREIIAEREKYARINPLDEVNLSNIARSYFSLGERDKAQKIVDKMEQYSPLHSMTANIKSDMLVLSDVRAAIEYLDNFQGELNAGTQHKLIRYLLFTNEIERAMDEYFLVVNELPNLTEEVFLLMHFEIVLLDFPQFKAIWQKKLAALNIDKDVLERAQIYARIESGHGQEDIAELRNLEYMEKDYIQIVSRDTMYAIYYATIKKMQGNTSYAKLLIKNIPDGFKAVIKLCNQSRNISLNCPQLLYLADKLAGDELLEYTENFLGGLSGPDFVYAKKYLLTSLDFIMLHDHPKFKEMAKRFIQK